MQAENGQTPDAQQFLKQGSHLTPIAPKKVRLLNRLVQGIGLLGLGQWSFYGIFRCPFIVPYIQCETCPVVTCHGRIVSLFWGFWLGLLIVALVFGRAFCGWLCPGGTVNRLIGFLGRKTVAVKLQPAGKADSLLPWGKYLTLVLVGYCWFILAMPRVNIPIRVGEFFPAVAQTFEFANVEWVVRTVIVLSLAALGLLLPSLWCRYVCPTGGLLDLFRKWSLYKVYKTGACNDCQHCRNACYMETRPGEKNCTNCGDCLGVCPQQCIHMGRER